MDEKYSHVCMEIAGAESIEGIEVNPPKIEDDRNDDEKDEEKE